MKPIKDRDQLDQRISDTLRKIPLGRPLPPAGPDDLSDEQLLQLVDGTLSPAEHQTLVDQLAQSPLSRDRFEVMREALDEFSGRTRLSPEEDPTLSPLTRLVFAVSQTALNFLRGSLAPLSLDPAPMPVRGGAPASAPTGRYYRFEHQFGEHPAQIEIESVAERGMELRLAFAGELSNARARVSLHRLNADGSENLVESVALRSGAASFTDLQPDSYRIVVADSSVDVGQLLVDFLRA